MANKTTFSCGEALDIINAIALHKRLTTSLQKASVIELKADTVMKADTAGLQLMAALSTEVNKTGGQLIWKKPSEALISAAQQLGLEQAIGLS